MQTIGSGNIDVNSIAMQTGNRVGSKTIAMKSDNAIGNSSIAMSSGTVGDSSIALLSIGPVANNSYACQTFVTAMKRAQRNSSGDLILDGDNNIKFDVNIMPEIGEKTIAMQAANTVRNESFACQIKNNNAFIMVLDADGNPITDTEGNYMSENYLTEIKSNAIAIQTSNTIGQNSIALQVNINPIPVLDIDNEPVIDKDNHELYHPLGEIGENTIAIQTSNPVGDNAVAIQVKIDPILNEYDEPLIDEYGNFIDGLGNTLTIGDNAIAIGVDNIVGDNMCRIGRGSTISHTFAGEVPIICDTADGNVNISVISGDNTIGYTTISGEFSAESLKISSFFDDRVNTPPNDITEYGEIAADRIRLDKNENVIFNVEEVSDSIPGGDSITGGVLTLGGDKEIVVNAGTGVITVDGENLLGGLAAFRYPDLDPNTPVVSTSVIVSNDAKLIYDDPPDLNILNNTVIISDILLNGIFNTTPMTLNNSTIIGAKTRDDLNLTGSDLDNKTIIGSKTSEHKLYLNNDVTVMGDITTTDNGSITAHGNGIVSGGSVSATTLVSTGQLSNDNDTRSEMHPEGLVLKKRISGTDYEIFDARITSSDHVGLVTLKAGTGDYPEMQIKNNAVTIKTASSTDSVQILHTGVITTSGAITGTSLIASSNGPITGGTINNAHLNAITPVNAKSIVSLRGHSTSNSFTLGESPANSSYLIGNVTPQNNDSNLNNCIVLGDGELETAYNANTCVYGNSSMTRHVFKGTGSGHVIFNMQTRQIEGLELKDGVELSGDYLVIGTLPVDIESTTKTALLGRVNDGSIILGPSIDGSTGGILNTILPAYKDMSNCILIGPKAVDDMSSADTIEGSNPELTYVNSCVLGNRQTTRVVANGSNPIILDTSNRKINEMFIDSLSAGDSGSVLIGPHSRDYTLLGEIYRTPQSWMNGVPNVFAITNNFIAVGTTQGLYVASTLLNRSAYEVINANITAIDATDDYIFAAYGTESVIYTFTTQYPIFFDISQSFRALAIDALGNKIFYSSGTTLHYRLTIKDQGNIDSLGNITSLLNFQCDQLIRLGPVLLGLVHYSDNNYYIYAWNTNTIDVYEPKHINTEISTSSGVIITAEQISNVSIIIAVANTSSNIIKLYICAHNPDNNTITSLLLFSSTSIDLQSRQNFEIYNMTFVLDARFNPVSSVAYSYLALSTRNNGEYNVEFIVYDDPFTQYERIISTLEKVVAFAINPATNIEIIGIINAGNNRGHVRAWNTLRLDEVTYSNYNYSTVISNTRPANILKDASKTSQLMNSVLIGPRQPSDIPDSTIQNFVCSNAVILGNQETTRVAFNASTPITLRTNDRYFENLKQLARYELQDNLATGTIKPPGTNYFSNTGFGSTFDGYYTAIPWISDGMLYTMPESYLCVSLGERAGATVPANLAGNGGIPNKTFITPWNFEQIPTTRPNYSFMINLEVMRQRTTLNNQGLNNATPSFMKKFVNHCHQTISIPDTSIYIDNTGAVYLHAHTPKAAQDFMAIVRICSIKIYRVLWWQESTSWKYMNVEIGFYRYASSNPSFCRIVHTKIKPKVGLSWFAFTSLNIAPFNAFRDSGTKSTISVMPHCSMNTLDSSTLTTSTKILTLCDSRFTTSSAHGRRQWRFLPFSFKHTSITSATFKFSNGGTKTYTINSGGTWNGDNITQDTTWIPGYFTTNSGTWFYITEITINGITMSNINLVPLSFTIYSGYGSDPLLSFSILSASQHELKIENVDTYIPVLSESFTYTGSELVNTMLSCQLYHNNGTTRTIMPFQNNTGAAITPTCILQMDLQFTGTSMTINTPTTIVIQKSNCLLYQLSYQCLPCIASYYVNGWGGSSGNINGSYTHMIFWSGVIIWCHFSESTSNNTMEFIMPNTDKYFVISPDGTNNSNTFNSLPSLIYCPLAGNESNFPSNSESSGNRNGNIRITYPVFSLGYFIDPGTYRASSTSTLVDGIFSGYRLESPLFTSHNNSGALLLTYATVHPTTLDANSVNESSVFLKLITSNDPAPTMQPIVAIHKHYPDNISINQSLFCTFIRTFVYKESYINLQLKMMHQGAQFSPSFSTEIE
jgi:hypothetical protein